MEWVETTGRTVEEAKTAALEQLGVEEAEAEFEVVSEPKLGLFGRLREEARVRARVQPRYPRSKVDRRDRRRPRGAASSDDKTTARSGAPGRPAGTLPTDEADAGKRERQAKPRVRAKAGSSATTAEAETPKRRRAATPAGEHNADEGTKFAPVSTESLEEQAKLAEAFLKGLISEIGATANISSHPVSDGIVEVEIEGDGLGTLIGPKGAALVALQELTRTVVQRQTTGEGRVIVDINGYRKRRHEALAQFAQQVAAQVRDNGLRRALEPMPASDRKVVHDAVNSIEGVQTISEGEEPNRRVVLIPDAPGSSSTDGSSPDGRAAAPAAS